MSPQGRRGGDLHGPDPALKDRRTVNRKNQFQTRRSDTGGTPWDFESGTIIAFINESTDSSINTFDHGTSRVCAMKTNPSARRVWRIRYVLLGLSVAGLAGFEYQAARIAAAHWGQVTGARTDLPAGPSVSVADLFAALR